MQMHGFESYLEVELSVYHCAKCRISCFPWLHYFSCKLNSTYDFFTSQKTESVTCGQVSRRCIWSQLVAAVRSAADSCQSDNTASSSTLPHCHHQLWGWRGKDAATKSCLKVNFVVQFYFPSYLEWTVSSLSYKISQHSFHIVLNMRTIRQRL